MGIGGQFEWSFLNGEIRYLRFAGVEIVRRIFVAVRDAGWNTIPGVVKQCRFEEDEGLNRVLFSSIHRNVGIHYTWNGVFEGHADGTFRFSMRGMAHGDFQYNKIGICVLLPLERYVGEAFRASGPTGQITGRLPASNSVAPQVLTNGFETGLFKPFTRFEVDPHGHFSVKLQFDGDLFEMEDERNWTDGSLKIYSTPIAYGYPYTAAAGQSFAQSLVLAVGKGGSDDRPSALRPAKPHPARLDIEPRGMNAFPLLGLGLADGDAGFSAREALLLSALNLCHLRVDVHLSDHGWAAVLARATKAAAQVGASLELALFLNDESSSQLKMLRPILRNCHVARYLVFHEKQAEVGSTSKRWLETARRELDDGSDRPPFAGGVDRYFNELNRNNPDASTLETMDAVCFPVTPQAHFFDDDSLVEALQGQLATVLSARSLCNGLPVIVSPVTLRSRIIMATEGQEAAFRRGEQLRWKWAKDQFAASVERGELPGSVDPRQMSLFGAAWTVGSLAALSTVGVSSITYFETVGWKGVIEKAVRNGVPGQFHSFPGMVFPLYHVFRAIAPFRAGAVREVSASERLSLTGIAIVLEDKLLVIASNLTTSRQRVSIGPLPDGSVQLWRLNERTAPLAATSPERFWSTGKRASVSKESLSGTLLPYETAFIHARRA